MVNENVFMNLVNSPLKDLYPPSEHSDNSDWGTAQESRDRNTTLNVIFSVTKSNCLAQCSL